MATSSSDVYSQTTKAITVEVRPTYLDAQSVPEEGRHVWAYHVRIVNNSNAVAQLLTRHWRIIDATGHAHDVIGDGVVGEQPVLAPGESFEYTSGTPLATPSGFMSGSFRLIGEGGAQFDVAVPAFSLDCPAGPRPVH